ncbi:TasA family protein [Nocardioides dongkuii]|uniref:TasA family protein n=1 Tax=Nocardioides dongkuii TaxID=2760089 RepID=UPI0015FDF052|nr:TasA family protein [Nocardioides dongkuii]
MKHAAPRETGRVRPSGRLALAVLALVGAVVVLMGGQGTFAFWTDEATVRGTAIETGTLDLKVNGSDSHVTTTLGMAAMVPGQTSAEVVSVRNSGSAPLTYTVNAALTGPDAAAFASAGALELRVVRNGTRSGQPHATCTGGQVLATHRFVATGPTTVVAARQGPLAGNSAATPVCLQVSFSGSAPSSLQGRTTTLALTFAATSDVS